MRHPSVWSYENWDNTVPVTYVSPTSSTRPVQGLFRPRNLPSIPASKRQPVVVFRQLGMWKQQKRSRAPLLVKIMPNMWPTDAVVVKNDGHLLHQNVCLFKTFTYRSVLIVAIHSTSCIGWRSWRRTVYHFIWNVHFNHSTFIFAQCCSPRCLEIDAAQRSSVTCVWCYNCHH